MDYNKRIDDNFLKAEYVDGEVLQHTDMNELESVVKLGVNANYEDIQKIQDGTLSVENSNKLSGATLSKLSTEQLQSADNKIPTSAQAKAYIDTQISSIDLSGYASELYVQNSIANTVEIYDSNGNGIVDNAEKVNNHTVAKDVPADAKFTDTIYDDTEVRGLISDLDDDKVDKVTGKGLSTNDYTTTEKNKLAGIANNAQVNVLEKVSVNGTQQTISNKSVNISVPTQLSQLSDDSTHRLVTDTEKTTWNNKADISDIPSLTNYVKNTDYATSSTGGVIKTTSNVGTSMSNGYLVLQTKTYPEYTNAGNNLFVSKGTLDNVIIGKNLETANNKVTEITENSTDTEYPSAKAVYSFTNNISEELKEEDEYLNSVIEQLPRDEATGTSATLQPTIQAKMKMSLAPSELEQTTYTGKNLFNKDNISSVIDGTNNNGVITSTVNESSGTKNINIYFQNSLVPISANSTIYFSADIKLNSNSTGNYSNINDGTNASTDKIVSPTLSTTYQRYQTSYTYNEDFSFNKVLIQIRELVGSVEISNIMISTSDNIDFEPYVGGTASPNPEYPQDIHTISGDNSVVVCGKNLFDGIWELGSIDNTTGANAYDNQGIRSVNYIAVKPSTTYTISTKNNCSIFVHFYNQSKGYLSYNNVQNTPKTITTPDNCYYIRIRTRQAENITNLNLKCQVQLGSTAATYEPYVSQTAPINLGNIEYCKIGDYEDKFIRTSGKNLFDDTYNHLGMWSSTVGNTTTFGESATYLGAYCKVEAGKTYSISMQKVTSRFRVAVGTEIPTENTIGLVVAKADTQTKVENITIPTGYSYLYLYLSNTSETSDNLNLMINEGTTALPYEPYGTNQWYIKKNIGKVVLDGSENWAFDTSSSTPTNRSVIFVGNLIQYLMANRTYLSNYFVYGSTTSNRLVLNNNENRIYLSLEDSISGVTSEDTNTQKRDKCKAWLTNNNTDLYYILSTPTYTQITGELETQLENIYKNMLSYKGTTNVSQINNDLPFVLGVSAIKDINAMISELTNAIIELGGE